MKKFFQFILFAAIVGGAIYVVKNLLSPSADETGGRGSGVLPQEPVKSLDEAPLGGEVSADLLKILVCPEDKGPLELVDQGKFLLNPRNGYKYPIRNGIPVMLIEEGKKYRDSTVAKATTNGSGATNTEAKEA
ncbi:MAG TPA: Trm112 family protein [Caldilineaceae bacterium]|nr:Trm112 family protein [Caldilineaceae bacterium]